MFFLTLQQAGILDGTPFQSYQAQSGLPGWAQLQGQSQAEFVGRPIHGARAGKHPVGLASKAAGFTVSQALWAGTLRKDPAPMASKQESQER